VVPIDRRGLGSDGWVIWGGKAQIQTLRGIADIRGYNGEGDKFDFANEIYVVLFDVEADAKTEQKKVFLLNPSGKNVTIYLHDPAWVLACRPRSSHS
jgi:hypothetical protein